MVDQRHQEQAEKRTVLRIGHGAKSRQGLDLHVTFPAFGGSHGRRPN